MADKTNYAQSLMHMIKGNLGTGILAMPASFAHTGLINAIIGLPILCLVSTYCVHLLVKSSQRIESRSKGLTFKYATLAKHSFRSGPNWMRASSGLMCRLVDVTLLIAQIGVCCVYIVFVVDNIKSILATYRIHMAETTVFIAILPIALLLSYIRTLKRLAIASAFANLLQAVGIFIILEYLITDIKNVDMRERDNFRPLSEVALGFGSAMFAFEGISVVLPIYTRMKHSDRMSGWFGVINFSYVILLVLYFAMGFFGYLRFGREARDSITLNLPPEPLYDAVRALFAISVFLTYPLQFYVPNEIIWNWTRRNLLAQPDPKLTVVHAIEVVIPTISVTEKTDESKSNEAQSTGNEQKSKLCTEDKKSKADLLRLHNRYDYCCRTALVIVTFILAFCVPKLNLLMDLIGSISGTALSLILPPVIHIAAFWDESKGLNKLTIVLVDSLIIIFGSIAGISGSFFSVLSIINSFNE